MTDFDGSSFVTLAWIVAGVLLLICTVGVVLYIVVVAAILRVFRRVLRSDD